MKKRLIALVLVLLIISAVFAGCGLSEEEKSVVGKYALSQITVEGYPSITKDSYDYFTVEFFANKKCVIKSKAGINEYEANAEWKINDEGEIEIITRAGNMTATEKYKLSGNKFTGTNNTVINGESVSMTITFTRVDEE